MSGTLAAWLQALRTTPRSDGSQASDPISDPELEAVDPTGISDEPDLTGDLSRAPVTPDGATITRYTPAANQRYNLRIVHFARVTANCLVTGVVRNGDGSLAPLGQYGAGFGFRAVNDASIRIADIGLGIDPSARLEGINVIVKDAGVTSGAIFVLVQITIPLPDGSNLALQTLVSGYITSVQPRSWPGSPLVSSTDGEPRVLSLTDIPGPGAGLEYNFTVPVGVRWELVSFAGAFHSAAGLASLSLRLYTTLLTLIKWEARIASNQVAASTWNYYFDPGFPQQTIAAANAVQVAVPVSPKALATDVFQTLSIGGGGDQWNNVAFTLREWLDPSVFA